MTAIEIPVFVLAGEDAKLDCLLSKMDEASAALLLSWLSRLRPFSKLELEELPGAVIMASADCDATLVLETIAELISLVVASNAKVSDCMSFAVIRLTQSRCESLCRLQCCSRNGRRRNDRRRWIDELHAAE